MSLLIVGSCSKVAQNIILQLNKTQMYKSITITDLLPNYDFHKRFYKLQQELSQTSSSLALSINKLISINNLAQQINEHQDVLYITHDYFFNVTSKTKLMEITAELAKKVSNLSFRKIMYSLFHLSNMIIMAIKILKPTSPKVKTK